MNKYMKTFALTGREKMEMQERPMPEIVNDTDVLIRMIRVGVCGSDMHYYKDGAIGSQVISYPFTPGHEGAGIVASVGKGVHHVKVGDRVAIDPAMPCGHCDQCEAGRPHTCRNLKFLGNPGQAEGCLSEYIVIPESSCYPINNRLGFDEAVVSEPLAIGYYATQLAGDLKGKSIGILGFGPIGMSVLLPAMEKMPKKVFVTDKLEHRLKIARGTGAHWTGNPNEADIVSEISRKEPLLLDFVFECCGKQEAVDEAVQLLKPGGTLLIVGIPEFSHWSFPVDDLRRKEITIQNVRRQNGFTRPALDLMADSTMDVSPMVTHHFPFEETDKAYALVANYEDGVMKAMIDFSANRFQDDW